MLIFPGTVCSYIATITHFLGRTTRKANFHWTKPWPQPTKEWNIQFSSTTNNIPFFSQLHCLNSDRSLPCATFLLSMSWPRSEPTENFCPLDVEKSHPPSDPPSLGLDKVINLGGRFCHLYTMWSNYPTWPQTASNSGHVALNSHGQWS